MSVTGLFTAQVVITDSIQLGDRPANDKAMGAFQDFNEPYYRSYTAEDMGASHLQLHHGARLPMQRRLHLLLLRCRALLCRCAV